uniref:(northern house mosquito) hypothetical protein n=1 Tax=Culex pipiens TaxID=7175 RepID=A0A8D8CKH1_CULPI
MLQSLEESNTDDLLTFGHSLKLSVESELDQLWKLEVVEVVNFLGSEHHRQFDQLISKLWQQIHVVFRIYTKMKLVQVWSTQSQILNVQTFNFENFQFVE